jgi:hypothetical protein
MRHCVIRTPEDTFYLSSHVACATESRHDRLIRITRQSKGALECSDHFEVSTQTL